MASRPSSCKLSKITLGNQTTQLGSLEADSELELGMRGLYWDPYQEGRGRKQAWAEGEVEQPYRPDRASANPTESMWGPVRVAHVGPKGRAF